MSRTNRYCGGYSANGALYTQNIFGRFGSLQGWDSFLGAVTTSAGATCSGSLIGGTSGWLENNIFPGGLVPIEPSKQFALYDAHTLFAAEVQTSTLSTFVLPNHYAAGSNLGISHFSGPLCAVADPYRPRLAYTVKAVNAVCSSAGVPLFTSVVLQFWDEAFSMPSSDSISAAGVLFANFPLSSEPRIRSLLSMGATFSTSTAAPGACALRSIRPARAPLTFSQAPALYTQLAAFGGSLFPF